MDLDASHGRDRLTWLTRFSSSKFFCPLTGLVVDLDVPPLDENLGQLKMVMVEAESICSINGRVSGGFFPQKVQNCIRRAFSSCSVQFITIAGGGGKGTRV